MRSLAGPLSLCAAPAPVLVLPTDKQVVCRQNCSPKHRTRACPACFAKGQQRQVPTVKHKQTLQLLHKLKASELCTAIHSTT